MSDSTGRPEPDAVPTDPAAIQAAIERTQADLASRVDELQTRLSPQEIARRASTSARQRAHDAVRTPQGDLRVERLVAAAAAAVGLAGALLLRRRRR